MDRGAWQSTVHGTTKSTQGLATKSPLHQKELPNIECSQSPKTINKIIKI